MSKGKSGLSLAICKGIMEAHGGRMSVESGGLGRGSRFDFTVPAVDETASIADDGSAALNEHFAEAGRRSGAHSHDLRRP